MKVVGTMAICAHPMTEHCLRRVSSYCDELYIRFDGNTGDQALLERVQKHPKVKNVFISVQPFSPWVWHEESIRMLDEVKPQLVICLDDDEEFSEVFALELQRFWESDKVAMMFRYQAPMPTNDDRVILNGRAYPPSPHMKAYKWIPGLTYKPYQGYARVTEYAHDAAKHWMADTEIKHYCMYTQEMEKEKKAYIRKLYHSNPEVIEGWGDD